MTLIDDLLKREGGFVNDPSDRGGATKFGITLATLGWYLGRPATIDDVRNLDIEVARAIYEKRYLKAPGFDKISWVPLQNQLVDFGVNSGPQVAIMNLQEILGVETDGILGPKTLEALKNSDPTRVNVSLAKRRIMMITRIVRRDPSQVKFLSGWVSRALEFI